MLVRRPGTEVVWSAEGDDLARLLGEGYTPELSDSEKAEKSAADLAAAQSLVAEAAETVRLAAEAETARIAAEVEAARLAAEAAKATK